jgi:Anthrone oxygenase
MATITTIVCLILLGLLAGEELIVRWGVQPALASLANHAHLHARIALVKRLKVVVPILIVPTVIATAACLAFSSGQPGGAIRWAGLAALLTFVLLSALGTVPINIKINDWDADQPPANWRKIVHRWTVIDAFRSSAAVLTFLLFTIATVQYPS